VEGSYVHRNELFSSTKGEEFLEELSDCRLLKEGVSCNIRVRADVGDSKKEVCSVGSERVNLIPCRLYAIAESHDVTDYSVDANLLTGTINHSLLFAFQLLLHAWSGRAFQTTQPYLSAELKTFKICTSFRRKTWRKETIRKT
jgi:hypothetical protein